MRNIKEWRQEHGVSQMKLAVLVGVSLPTVSLWERGGVKPNDDNMAKLEAVMSDYKEVK